MVLFSLEGDIKDKCSNVFDWSEDKRVLTRKVRVPKERLDAGWLLYGKDVPKDNVFGHSDAHLMVVETEITKRLEVCGLCPDKNGDYWEECEEIQLPFPCNYQLYNKRGAKISTYMIGTNENGFSWGYFWLKYFEKVERPRRISGQRVKHAVADSIYTIKPV